MKTYGKNTIQKSSIPLVEDTKNGTLKINTPEYQAQVLPELPQGIQDGLISKVNFRENIESILSGRPVGRTLNNVPIIDVQYPNDIPGSLRYEGISSIGYKDDGDIHFITRKRPNINKTNTPGAEDAGVIFHGIDNGQAISPRRFMADNFGKLTDDEITGEQVQNFSRFFQKNFSGYELIILGYLILTSGSIARQDQTPTSAIMQGSIVLLSKDQVTTILETNKQHGNNNYTVHSAQNIPGLPNPTNGEYIPKLEAYLELLRTKI